MGSINILSRNKKNYVEQQQNTRIEVQKMIDGARKKGFEDTNLANDGLSNDTLAHSLRDKAQAAYACSDLLEKRAEMMEALAQFISESKDNVFSIRL